MTKLEGVRIVEGEIHEEENPQAFWGICAGSAKKIQGHYLPKNLTAPYLNP